jgi:hypothetical protein
MITTDLYTLIEELQHENVETTNCLYEIYNRIDYIQNMYENLTEFERALARFGDKVDLIVGLELGDKITQEEAYQQIKELYKDLKKLRKREKNDF